MKIRTIVILGGMSLLVLTGCGTSTTPTAVDTSGLTKYSGIGFSIKTPASWEQVDVTKVSAPIRGKFELAMRSLINKRGFMNNIVILSEPMVTETSSGEYARQSMLWASREYLSTTIVSDEAMKFDDGTTSQLGIFRAKYNEITEEHLFFQTAKVCGKTIYLITLGLSNDTDPTTYDQYRQVLASFTCTVK